MVFISFRMVQYMRLPQLMATNKAFLKTTPLASSTHSPNTYRYHSDLRFIPQLVPKQHRNERAAVIEVEEYHRIFKSKEKAEAGTLDPEQDDGKHSPGFPTDITFYNLKYTI